MSKNIPNYIILNWLIIILSLLSCKKDKIGPQFEENNSSNSPNIFILNEGNFQFSNASISSYNSNNKLSNNNAFRVQNNFGLGDVLQSASVINNQIWIVVNNSNKIVVVDTNNLNFITEIIGFNSPRYCKKVNNNNVYVTDLYSNNISIVDIQTKVIIGNISIGDWTEELEVINNQAFVCSYNAKKILKINTSTHSIVDEVVLNKGVKSITKDENNQLWVLADGGINEDTAAIYKINPDNLNVIKSFKFQNVNESPSRLRVNKEYIYYLNNHVYRTDTGLLNLPTTPFINGNQNNFYGLNIIDDEVFVTDAIDFIQKGKVYRYNNNGSLIDEFETGIIPQFVFGI